ncbi:MAG: helix-turn-helix domain-containing protein [Candidatus Nitrosotenuis sp.]
MTRQTTQNLKKCPIHNTFDLVGKKFTILILRNMMLYGQTRFSQFLEDVEEINSKSLSQRLREMERDGLIERKVFAEIPPRVEYSLTEKGLMLRPILEQMGQYSTKYCAMDVFKDRHPREFKKVLSELDETNTAFPHVRK